MKQINPGEVAQRLSDGWAPFVLDVRNETEAAIASLEQTDLLCPHDALERVVKQLPTDREILVYCRSGGRSAYACAWLEAQGFESTYNLDGGINEWARSVDSSLQEY